MRGLQKDLLGIAKQREARRKEEENRRKNKLKAPQTSAPTPPPAHLWDRYEVDLVLSFFWRWIAAERNPMFTPDGKAWLDQDPDFWKLIDFLDDTWIWAERQTETL